MVVTIGIGPGLLLAPDYSRMNARAVRQGRLQAVLSIGGARIITKKLGSAVGRDQLASTADTAPPTPRSKA
jgi:hypothetical protein